MKDKQALVDKVKDVVHRNKFTCTIPNENFEEIIQLVEEDFKARAVEAAQEEQLHETLEEL